MYKNNKVTVIKMAKGGKSGGYSGARAGGSRGGYRGVGSSVGSTYGRTGSRVGSPAAYGSSGVGRSYGGPNSGGIYGGAKPYIGSSGNPVNLYGKGSKDISNKLYDAPRNDYRALARNYASQIRASGQSNSLYKRIVSALEGNANPLFSAYMKLGQNKIMDALMYGKGKRMHAPKNTKYALNNIQQSKKANENYWKNAENPDDKKQGKCSGCGKPTPPGAHICIDCMQGNLYKEAA